MFSFFRRQINKHKNISIFQFCKNMVKCQYKVTSYFSAPKLNVPFLAEHQYCLELLLLSTQESRHCRDFKYSTICMISMDVARCYILLHVWLNVFLQGRIPFSTFNKSARSDEHFSISCLVYK